MSPYMVRFEWPAGAAIFEDDVVELNGDTFEITRIQAAMLYAGVDFKIAPAAYRILQNGATEVYRRPGRRKRPARSVPSTDAAFAIRPLLAVRAVAPPP